MSKVVLAVDISGTRNGKDWPPRGTEVDLPEDEARDLVRSGQAFDPADEDTDDKVKAVKGELFDKLELAGAPEGRDWTEGSPDTNLARARALALDERDSREIAREAAKDTDMDDAHTVPGRNPDAPTVGDGKPDPTEAGPVEAAVIDDKPTGRKPAGAPTK